MNESNDSMDRLYEDLSNLLAGREVLDVVGACLAILQNIPLSFETDRRDTLNKSIVSLLKMSIKMMESKDE